MSDGKQIPTRLKSEPLIDVTIELRFISTGKDVVSLLPGILEEALNGFDKIERLPIANIPQQLQSLDEFSQQPHLKLVKDNISILVGPTLIAVSCSPPYMGWSQFKSKAIEVFLIANKKSFAESVTRYSLRYTDIISLGPVPTLNWLKARFDIGNLSDNFESFQLRLESVIEDARIIIQIATPAKSSIDERTGIVVDVDTISSVIDDFWVEHEPKFDKLHQINKETFFGLLTDDTIAALMPEY